MASQTTPFYISKTAMNVKSLFSVPVDLNPDCYTGETMIEQMFT